LELSLFEGVIFKNPPKTLRRVRTYINTCFFLSVLEQLGGKQIVMQHLGHEDPNVRYEALLAVQKLMVHNWLVWILSAYSLMHSPYPAYRSCDPHIIHFQSMTIVMIKILCALKILFVFIIREYLGKQLEKENENQKQGSAPITGKA